MYVVSVLHKTKVDSISTLVPHASDIMVAAITDSTLADLKLFPDIVVPSNLTS